MFYNGQRSHKEAERGQDNVLLSDVSLPSKLGATGVGFKYTLHMMLSFNILCPTVYAVNLKF